MVTTAATEVVRPATRNAARLPGAWSTSRATLFAVVLDGLAALVAGGLVGLTLLESAAAGLLWATFTAVSVASGPFRPKVVYGVLRAAALAGFVCWVSETVLSLPAPDGRLIVLLGVLTVVSLLLRLVAGADSPTQRVLVVGEAGDREALAGRLGELTKGRLTPVGSCAPEAAVEAILAEDADAVLVVPGPGFDGRSVQRLTWELEALDTPLLVTTRLHDIAPRRAETVRLGSLAVLRVSQSQRTGVRRLAKRLWEQAAAAFGLVLLAPVLLVVAVAIRIDSKGPVLFRQERVGRFGEPFTMLKFRTMCVDAEERLRELEARPDHVLFKMQEDPRVTRVGRLLRRYSLDELPQLVNVVRGDMALIGPRPALPAELAEYDDDPLRRLVVSPGITGLWQVSGRSDLPWDESVRLDLDYVDNWSLGHDLSILLRTVRAVLGHSGAY